PVAFRPKPSAPGNANASSSTAFGLSLSGSSSSGIVGIFVSSLQLAKATKRNKKIILSWLMIIAYGINVHLGSPIAPPLLLACNKGEPAGMVNSSVVYVHGNTSSWFNVNTACEGILSAAAGVFPSVKLNMFVF